MKHNSFSFTEWRRFSD